MYEINSVSLKELAKEIDGELIGENLNVKSISLNSKEKTSQNAIFAALKGKRYNANAFVSEAVENGAVAILTDEKLDTEIPYIKVQNSTKALGLIAKRNIKRTKVIGVTGSVGKTTTKNMIISVLGSTFSVSGTNENENNEIGVAKTLLKVKKEDFCVLEMGMRAKGDIDYLASISHPETAIVTNIGTAHIERLGSRENIFKAKMEILNYNPENFISTYDKFYSNYQFKTAKNTYFVGDGTLCNTEIIDITKSYIIFRVLENGKKSDKMKIYSLNEANLLNALIAYKLGKIYGLSDKQIASGISSYKHESMREEIVTVGDILVINDAYNSSLESVKKSIEMLINYSKSYKKEPYLLLGDILESGENDIDYYEEIAKECSKFNLKRVYLFGEKILRAKNLFKDSIYCNNFKDMASLLTRKLGEKDLLLLKGSRDVKLERIIEEMRRIKP